jgi:membrane protease subunit (stomatin/prohibitin family)
VSLQEISNNKFGSASEIYWDDKYLNAQVGAQVRGTYSLKIVDPLAFLRNFVPNRYIQDGKAFDFSDLDNPAAQQLFNEVVGSLAAAFSSYANAPEKENRMSRIQQDAVGFGASLFAAVDDAYKWKVDRGLEIVKTAIVSIEYDAATKEVLSATQRADALSGARGNANLQASVAAGLEAAGSVEGSAGILGLGFAAGSLGLGNLQQNADSGKTAETSGGDVRAALEKLKDLLDSELITQSDYEAAKAKLLGL